jgi:hypothetical protein
MTNSMPVFKRRLGASICLTVFSIVSIIMLLPSSQVSTQLQKIALGGSIDNVAALWDWGTDEGDEEEKGGIRLVVFGDSWVDDTVENGQSGKGKTWVEVLCEVVCSLKCYLLHYSGLFLCHPKFRHSHSMLIIY